MEIREPAVAGMFYPGDAAGLRRQVEALIPRTESPVDALAIVAPHAGYVYSGACAGLAWSGLVPRDTIVIVGVNHRGIGASLAVDAHAAWRTPLGETRVDLELARALTDGSPLFSLDSRAGMHEHSLEVQVPFVQMAAPEASILPITVGAVAPEKIIEAGVMLAATIRSIRPNALLVASTDMSHYISAAAAERMDRQAIERIMALDPSGLMRVVMIRHISMCGVAPTALVLKAAMERGASRVEEVCYTHSGAVTGDDSEVVAYWSGRILA